MKKSNFLSDRNSFVCASKVDRYSALFILSCFIFILNNLTIEGKLYIPQLIVLTCSPFLLLKGKNNLYYVDIIIILLSFAILLQAIINPLYFKPSSAFFSVSYLLTYFSYRKLIKRNAFTISSLMTFLRITISIMSVVLLIQQISVVFGLPVFNLISDGRTIFKLNSLTWESSNLALLAPLFLFCYIRLREIDMSRKYKIRRDVRDDYVWWLLILYLSFTCGSTTSFFSMAGLMLYFINIKQLPYLFLIIIFLFLGMSVLCYFEIIEIDRLNNLFSVLFSNTKLDKLILIDASAACRIVPYFVWWESIDISDINFWLGHGIGRSEDIATYLIIGNDLIRERVGAANICTFFYDYGMISAVLFVFLVRFSIATKWISYEMFFYIFNFSVLPLNHIVLWVFILLMYSVYRFEMSKRRLSFLIANKVLNNGKEIEYNGIKK